MHMANSSSAGMIFLVTLVLLLACQIGGIKVELHTPTWGRTGWSIAINHTFESHGTLLQTYRNELATDYQVVHNPVMERQPRLPRQQPPRWLLVNISGWDNDYIVLATRSDNGYAIGFQQLGGPWYALKGHQHLIPGSIPLNFGDTYSDFFGVDGGGFLELATLILGKNSFLTAVRGFARFNPTDAESEKRLKHAFALMTLMICESVRIVPIRNTVLGTWETQGGQISKRMARLAVNWGNMSYRLLCWSEYFPWESQTATNLRKQVKIRSAREALKTVDLLLWPSRFNPENLQRSCYDPVRDP